MCGCWSGLVAQVSGRVGRGQGWGGELKRRRGGQARVCDEIKGKELRRGCVCACVGVWVDVPGERWGG